MEPLFLQSEDALYFYLKKFLKEKPNAAQLDGSAQPKANSAVIVSFRYSVDGKKYKLLADCTRKAIKEFVQIADEHGSPAVALRDYEPASGPTTLILATHDKPDGWHCAPWLAKASNRLKKAA